MWVQNLGGLHFPAESSEVCVNIKTLSYSYRLLLSVDVFPGFACGKFSECQPHGEYHEAAEGTSPVPLVSAQTVCFLRCDICQLYMLNTPNCS